MNPRPVPPKSVSIPVHDSSPVSLRTSVRKLLPGLLAVAGSAIFAILVYSRLPERVVSHWGADGTPDGWTSRAVLVGGIFAIELGSVLLMIFAPRIDPRRNNFKTHAGAYWLVMNSALVLVTLATSFALGDNLGWRINIGWLSYAVALLFIAVGNVMTRIRPNWIFGVRTPWTLSSDRSWRETHRLAGYGMVTLGVVLLGVAAVRADLFSFVLIPGVLIVSLASVLRSYFVWKDEATAVSTK